MDRRTVLIITIYTFVTLPNFIIQWKCLLQRKDVADCQLNFGPPLNKRGNLPEYYQGSHELIAMPWILVVKVYLSLQLEYQLYY